MRLIVLGDLHLCQLRQSGRIRRPRPFLYRFFRQVAAHEADLVIAVGDTTEGSLVDQLAREDEIARQAGLDLWRIIGNHDAYCLDKSDIARFFLGGQPGGFHRSLHRFRAWTGPVCSAGYHPVEG